MMNSRKLRYLAEEIRRLRSSDDLRHLAGKVRYYMAQRQYRRHRDTGLPLCLQLEPTNYCNINCICCSQAGMRRPRGYLPSPLFKKIINDAVQSRIDRVHFYLHGEPFLHPEIVPMIRRMKREGIGISIATNGMLLDKDLAHALLKAGMNSADHITFSILGFSQAVHESIMRGVCHQTVVQNLHDLLAVRRARRQSGPTVETLMYLMPQNQAERHEFVRHWRGIVDHVREVGEISKQFTPNFATLPRRTQTCTNLWERMTVFWNGDVTTCIADLDGAALVCNLRDQSIQQVWQGEALARIRDLHRLNQFRQLKLCKRCDW